MLADQTMGLGQHIPLVGPGPDVPFETGEHPADDPGGLPQVVQLLGALDGLDIVEEVGAVHQGGGVAEGALETHVVSCGGDIGQPHDPDGPMGDAMVRKYPGDLDLGGLGGSEVLDPVDQRYARKAPQRVPDESRLTFPGENHHPPTSPLEDVAHVLHAAPYELVAPAADDHRVDACPGHGLAQHAMTPFPLGGRRDVGQFAFCHFLGLLSCWGSGSTLADTVRTRLDSRVLCISRRCCRRR